ncbi:MAG TPA: DNA polymerase I [Erysipelotrichaceae bacterium]|nr:DNA polymerase I [Erysipelotrichaceae bacterium]
MENFLLVDGNSLLFRAYYATAYRGVLQTSYGKYTNAIVAFNNMLINVIESEKPDYILVAFDTKDKTFRHNMFKDYKAQRKPAPVELIEQFETVRDLLDAMNIARYEVSGYEADDIIGTLSKRYKDIQMNILTSDQDMLQLVDDNTDVLLMKTGVSNISRVSLNNFEEEYEIRPDQVVDLKAMMGDSADNIPGIPGIGIKTGIKLIHEFDTLENLLENTDKLTGKRKENVEANVEIAKMSKTLARIKTDIEIEINPKDFELNIDYNSLYMFYKEYEMNRQANKIKDKLEGNEEVADFKIIEVEKISKNLLVENSFIWVESEGDYQSATLKLLTVSDGKRVEVISEENFKKDAELIKWLESDDYKIVYDAKFLYHLFNRYDIDLNGVSEDLMIAAFLVDNATTDWTSFLNKYGGTQSDIQSSDEVDLDVIASKAYDLMRIKNEIISEIKEKSMDYLYYNVELPLAKILYEMEVVGIRVDKDIIVEIADKTEKIINEVSQKIYDYAGREFNINSPKQLSEVLFDELELPQIKKRSTAIDILEKLQGQHPIIDEIMKQRKYQKLFSTYADGLQKFISDKGRIHTIYHQTKTQTGRLSSTDPNLQNISVRDEEAREVRKAFVADEDSVLMAFDYSQVELRILAHMAKEEKLIKAFKDGLDIHAETAKDIFELSEVEKADRHKAKAVNFGIIYGISDYGLSEQLHIPVSEAKKYIDKYLETYPGIKTYMDETIEFCKKEGYVKTLINRRREIPEITSSNYMVRQFGQRAAMNAPIQGSAADLIKIAMVRIANRIKIEELESNMILQVHDELIFNVVASEVEVMKNIVSEEMNHAMTLDVPLRSDGSTAKDWYGL